MTDDKLADDIEKFVPLDWTLYRQQIIAALRQSDPVLGECEECGHTIVTPLKRLPERQPESNKVLVPREPTFKMICDGHYAYQAALDENHNWQVRLDNAYRAMLAAAEAEEGKS